MQLIIQPANAPSKRDVKGQNCSSRRRKAGRKQIQGKAAQRLQSSPEYQLRDKVIG